MTSSTHRKIVVGLDGSESATSSLRWASALAKSQGGTVLAIMAWNYPTAYLLPLIGTPVSPAEFAADNARDALNEALESAPNLDMTIERSVVMGTARAVLTEASEDHDLLIVGRTGNSRLKQIFLGSTVSYCVRHADCPVVVVRDANAPEHGVTVAVDGSPSSIEALVWAIGLGDDHEIVAVYSHDERELDAMSFDDPLRQNLDEKADTMLAEAVATAVQRTGTDPNRINRQVRQGDPRTTLVDQADSSRLLVLGAQGHSGFAGWMLGSLTDYAVQHAPGTVAIWR